MEKKYKLLFVCLGNICRSPAAEGLMKALVEKRGVADHFFIDSAGIGGWHVGDLPDERMIAAAGKRGYNLNSRARKFYPESDFNEFDLIIGMDNQNIRDLRSMAQNDGELAKIHRMTDFCLSVRNRNEVPDPYFGGDDGFEDVLNLLEDATGGLLEKLMPAIDSGQ